MDPADRRHAVGPSRECSETPAGIEDTPRLGKERPWRILPDFAVSLEEWNRGARFR
jgi:hypothetical protein